MLAILLKAYFGEMIFQDRAKCGKGTELHWEMGTPHRKKYAQQHIRPLYVDFEDMIFFFLFGSKFGSVQYLVKFWVIHWVPYWDKYWV